MFPTGLPATVSNVPDDPQQKGHLSVASDFAQPVGLAQGLAHTDS